MTDSCELQLERGALVLRGFDDLLRLARGCCTTQDAARQIQRDGAHAHLTLLSKHETRAAAAALARENGDSAPSADASAVLAFARRFVAGATIRGQSILPVGLGRASTSHFVVVLWPRGAALRARLGLAPVDCHVTLGFSAANHWSSASEGRTCQVTPSIQRRPVADKVWAVASMCLAVDHQRAYLYTRRRARKRPPAPALRLRHRRRDRKT